MRFFTATVGTNRDTMKYVIKRETNIKDKQSLQTQPTKTKLGKQVHGAVLMHLVIS